LISLILGIAINYGFGVLSYVLEWNRSPAYSILWTFANPFLVVTYASMNLIQDKGLTRMTIVMCVISMLLSFGPGILLLVWFNLIEVGIVFIGIGFYYTYFVSIYLIYTRMNNSVHFSIYPITICLIVATCFAVMVYSFLSDTFDDFYGFSITYLVVNLLLLIYAIYRVVSDILTRADKPNFYSPYGLPIYKYDYNIKSVV
jgi:hypothetical protein